MLATSPPAQKKPFAEQAALWIVDILAAAGGLLATLLVAPLTGALSGWVLSLFIPNWICGGFNTLGLNVHPSDLYKIGAALAWAGGFLRYSANINKDKAKK